MSDLTNEFEHLLYRLAYRMVRSAIREDHSGHIDDKIGKYVDDYAKSPRILNDVGHAIQKLCQEDGELGLRVKQVVQDLVNQELESIIIKRLNESKVGDRYFVDWLVSVALKKALTTEAVIDAIDSAVKVRVEQVMKDVLTRGLWGSPK